MSGFTCLLTHMPSWCGKLQFRLILNHLETDTACFECDIVYKEGLIFTLQSLFKMYGTNARVKTTYARTYLRPAGRPAGRPYVTQISAAQVFVRFS